jgi:hypothetical protein
MQSIGTTTKKAIRRLIGALESICREPLGDQEGEQPLDPSILLGIDRQAERVAEIYDDPLAGEYARRLMTESARAVFKKFDGVRSAETAAETEATATLLQQPPRGRT